MSTRTATAPRAEESAVITKATLRAAERLDVTARALSMIIGVSEATVSRMRKSEFLLDRGSKP
ncbi:antitoxin Xre-like helix-turn-helix domain-containing protein, partial [Rhizobium ruizarguesonis]